MYSLAASPHHLALFLRPCIILSREIRQMSVVRAGESVIHRGLPILGEVVYQGAHKSSQYLFRISSFGLAALIIHIYTPVPETVASMYQSELRFGHVLI
jgi:hypothetical protein